MAFTSFPGFTVDWTTKATKISGQATNMKSWLNARANDVKTWLDSILADLASTTDSDSGADQIGMTKLANYGSAAAATAQAQAEALDAALKANATADAAHLADTTKHATAWANWTPTLVWTGGSPTITSVAARKMTDGSRAIVKWKILGSDGKGATDMTSTLPVAPKANSMTPVGIVCQLVNAALKPVITCCVNDNGVSNLLIMNGMAELTNGQAFELEISIDYEIDI